MDDHVSQHLRIDKLPKTYLNQKEYQAKKLRVEKIGSKELDDDQYYVHLLANIDAKSSDQIHGEPREMDETAWLRTIQEAIDNNLLEQIQLRPVRILAIYPRSTLFLQCIFDDCLQLRCRNYASIIFA